MNAKQAGFTLIELVMVIVILGILAAVAIPKFVDLSSEAKTAALDGVKGSLASAMAINYATCAVVGNVAGAKCVAVSNCSDSGNIVTGGLPSGYTVAAANIGTSNGTTTTCTITQVSGGATATFTGISAGNS